MPWHAHTLSQTSPARTHALSQTSVALAYGDAHTHAGIGTGSESFTGRSQVIWNNPIHVSTTQKIDIEVWTNACVCVCVLVEYCLKQKKTVDKVQLSRLHGQKLMDFRKIENLHVLIIVRCAAIRYHIYHTCIGNTINQLLFGVCVCLLYAISIICAIMIVPQSPCFDGCNGRYRLSQ